MISKLYKFDRLQLDGESVLIGGHDNGKNVCPMSNWGQGDFDSAQCHSNHSIYVNIMKFSDKIEPVMKKFPCRIPRRPPFTAYVANLPYDVDEGQVQEVFERARLKVGGQWEYERLELISNQLRSRKSD